VEHRPRSHTQTRRVPTGETQLRHDNPDELREHNLSYRKIAEELGLSTTTVYKYVNETEITG
jgi:transposase